MITIRFKGDKRLRDRFMVSEAFQHPAKLGQSGGDSTHGVLADCILRDTDNSEMPVGQVGGLSFVSPTGGGVVMPPPTIYFNYGGTEWQQEIHSVEADDHLRLVNLSQLVQGFTGELFRHRFAFRFLIASLRTINAITPFSTGNRLWSKGALTGFTLSGQHTGVPMGIVRSCHTASAGHSSLEFYSYIFCPCVSFVPSWATRLATVFLGIGFICNEGRTTGITNPLLHRGLVATSLGAEYSTALVYSHPRGSDIHHATAASTF